MTRQPDESEHHGTATVEWRANGATFATSATLDANGTLLLSFSFPHAWSYLALDAAGRREFLLRKDAAEDRLNDLLLGQIFGAPTIH